jgi:hypothetical protein
MPDLSYEMEVFYLLEMLLSNVMASSKNNENTVPISGGSVGRADILHNEIIVQKKIH